MIEPPRKETEHCCPECGSELTYRKTVQEEYIWLCKKCPFCTRIKTDLKKIKEEPNNEYIMPERPPMTEQDRKILANVLIW